MSITPPPNDTATDIGEAAQDLVQAKVEIKCDLVSPEDSVVDTPGCEDIEYKEENGEDDGEENALDEAGEIADGDFIADSPAAPAPKKATDKRKNGGPLPGRTCNRWTPSQEDAALKVMKEVRAEGMLTGAARFEEVYSRLIAIYGSEWNHSASGINNYWHRRKLGPIVYREEARNRIEKERQERREDEELGLIVKGNRVRKRSNSTTTNFIVDTKREPSTDDIDGDVLAQTAETAPKRRRLVLGSSDMPLHRETVSNTPFSSSPPPVDLPQVQARDFPSVTIAFKHFANDTRRKKPFSACRTVRDLFTQAVTGHVFQDTRTQYMVLAAKVGASKKYVWMAQNDQDDYDKLVERIERAVDAAGGEDVVVDVKAVV